jgi:hypothetical protein
LIRLAVGVEETADIGDARGGDDVDVGIRRGTSATTRGGLRERWLTS